MSVYWKVCVPRVSRSYNRLAVIVFALCLNCVDFGIDCLYTKNINRKTLQNIKYDAITFLQSDSRL